MNVRLLLISGVVAPVLLALAPVVKAQNWGDLNCGEDYSPVKSSAPVYPKRARQRGIEGSIEMQFTILIDGKVDSIEVKEASRKVFIRSATRAVTELEFPPCIQNGLATSVTGVSIKYDFNLQ